MDKNEVTTAFEILLEEIEIVVSQIKDAGTKAFSKDDYEKAKQAADEAARLAGFREKVRQLQKEWATIFVSTPPVHARAKRRKTKQRLKRGLRTPEDAFRKPILEALIELGGSAKASEVLDRVEKKMTNVLNEYDRQRLYSGSRATRWKNTAEWCRNTLVREGLMKNDSPRGVWEISEQGRQWLENESKIG